MMPTPNINMTKKKNTKLNTTSIVWMHLDEATFLISEARERELNKYNLSSVQMKVLIALNYQGNAPTIQELCQMVVRGHTSVSLLTDKMVAKGLVEKRQDSDNKNQTRVSITEKGKQTLHLFIRRKPIPDILSVLSEEECHELIGLLKKVIERSIEVTSPQYPPDLVELTRMLKVGTK
jgi:DNA-binding MarR family transcriptional regulator